MDMVNQPVQSKAGKLSIWHWNVARAPSTFETESSFLWLPPCAQKFSCRDHTGAGELMCWVRRVCHWRSVQKCTDHQDQRTSVPCGKRQSLRPRLTLERLHWYMSQPEDIVTVTSQHSALPLDQGTSVRPSGRLPSDLNKPEGSLVTVSYTHLTLPTNREV